MPPLRSSEGWTEERSTTPDTVNSSFYPFKFAKLNGFQNFDAIHSHQTKWEKQFMKTSNALDRLQPTGDISFLLLLLSSRTARNDFYHNLKRSVKRCRDINAIL